MRGHTFYAATAILFLTVILLVFAGCGGGDDGTVPELDSGWTIFSPGGSTICADGSNYTFFVRKGSVNKVLVYFEGGGACWNAETCALPYADRHKISIYTENTPQNIEDFEAANSKGIFDFSNPQNPFRDWYYVFVSYCSADVHYGDSYVEYIDPVLRLHVPIYHRGVKNAQSVLNWMYASFSSPERILITGCSAGAMGTLAWAPYILNQYPDSEASQFSDSFVGVMTSGLFFKGLPSWDAWKLFDESPVPGLDRASLVLNAPIMAAYACYKTADYFQTRMFSQYNSNADIVQTMFYDLSGGIGGGRAWTSQMRAYIDIIHGNAGNFASFTGAGNQHCYLPADDFYTMEEEGVPLLDWVTGLATGQPVDKDVDCAHTAEGCGSR